MARAHDSLLEMLLETVLDIVYSLDPEGNFLSYSAAGEKILGYAEMVGRSVFEIIHPDDRERTMQSIAESVRTKDEGIKTVEFRMVTSAGEVRDFEIRRRMIFEDGKVVRQDGIARDVTERKKLEREIALQTESVQNANMRLQTILDAAQNALVLAAADGQIIACNKATEQLFGINCGAAVDMEIEAFLGQVAASFVDQTDFIRLCERLQREPDTPEERDIDHNELFARGLESARLPGRYIAPFSMQTGEGRVSRLWIFTDVTKLKEADEQLHKIVDASPIPLIVTRVADGTIMFANDNLGELVGIPAKELEGEKSPDFYRRAEDRAEILERLGREGVLRNHEVELVRADGTTVWVILSLVATEIGGEPAVIGGIQDISERKRYEEELARERNFVNAILDTSSALVIVLDREGRIVRLNGACERTTGFTFEEVKDDFFWDYFIAEEELERTKEVFCSLKAGNFPNTHENYWLAKDGSRRIISWSNTALVGADGEVEHIVGTGIDVTEARIAEESLKLYREIYMNADDGIVIIDPDGTIIERNPSHREFSGYSDEELYGKGLGLFFGDENAALFRRVIESKGAYQGEITVHSKGGERKDVDLAVFPIYSDEGKLLYYISMGRNISARKGAEAALRDSEETFRSISASAQDAVVMIDNDGRVSFWNDSAEQIFGWPAEEALGKELHSLLAPATSRGDYEPGFALFRQRGEGNVVGKTVRLDAQRRDGTEVPIELSVSAVKLKGRWNAIGIARDITERVRAEEERARAAEALRAANRELQEKQAQLVQSEKMAALGMLVAGIAHEINTPIGAVNSVHDTLVRSTEKLKQTLQRDFPAEVAENRRLKTILSAIESSNQVIESGTARVTEIVRRLKSFARLDEAELKEVDIHEGLEDTLTIIHHEIKHKAEVIKRFGELPTFPCYPGPINQVFLNLLINAGQAIADKGQIVIATRAEGQRALIEIIDDGAGIHPDHLARIFDPGFTTKGVGVGTGLGLSICYQIIKDHHGEIRAESELGKGTKVTVILPTNLDQIMGEKFKG